jgi:predicted nuclease of predicted toxin-antitoxin system
MKIVIDMNLSPAWCMALAAHGHEAVHWSIIGNPGDADTVIMQWALANHHIVLTHDLDFGTLLALTRARGPSVIQVRTQKVLPDDIGNIVVQALSQCATDLENGALVVVDTQRSRTRILPLF